MFLQEGLHWSHRLKEHQSAKLKLEIEVHHSRSRLKRMFRLNQSIGYNYTCILGLIDYKAPFTRNGAYITHVTYI